MSYWLDAQIAMDILDRVHTEEQRNTLDHLLKLFSVFLKKPAYGLQYLLASVKEGAYFPLPFQGHSVCYCFMAMSNVLNTLVNASSVLLPERFPGAEPFPEPKRRSAFMNSPMIREYPAVLIQRIAYLSGLGCFNHLAQLEICWKQATECYGCNDCRLLKDFIPKELTKDEDI